MTAEARLLAALEATWPPAARRRVGAWTIRDGQGGGKRVSAATAEAPVTAADLAVAEAAMAALGQPALVMVRAGEAALDALLAEAGYAVVDPVDLLAAPLAALDLPRPPRLSAIPAWPPLAIQREIWAAGGIGPARLAIMARAEAPKTALLARVEDRAAGTAFVAVHAGIAMVHALEIAPRFRRQGAARHLMAGAAHWARAAGATDIALVVTAANRAAQALYASLGIARVGHWHYRIKREEAPPP